MYPDNNSIMSPYEIQHDADAELGGTHESEGCCYAGPRVHTPGASRLLKVPKILPVLTIRANVHRNAANR